MYTKHIPQIAPGSKVLIGLGDSYTQGVGAYSEETYWKNNYKIEVFTQKPSLIAEQYEGSWVNQICQKHLKGWIPVNMGHAGVGNRAAVKQLYLNTQVNLENAEEVIVVLMLSGLERFDFVRKDYSTEDHYTFEAMWPNPQDPTAKNKSLWQAYADHVYSDVFIAVELILNILEAQTYCKAHGYRFVFGSAFDGRANRTWLVKTLCGLMTFLKPQHKKLINQIDWSNFIYPKGYDSFLQYLLRLEGNENLASGGWYHHYMELPRPSTYITNCAHPTRQGHEVIADILYENIKDRL